MATAAAPGEYASAGPVRIHYQDTGAGPPLLVLNGWSASGLIWPQEWVAELESDFRVLRVCNRGTGWSDPVQEPFTLGDMVADALAVLDAEGIEQAHVFGLSMGGMIAQHLAAEHPERVFRLVLAATAPPPPDLVPAAPEVLSRVMNPPRSGTDPQDFVASIWSSIVGPGFQERGADVLARLVDGVIARPTPLNVILLQMQAINEQSRGAAAAITAPTLVLHGADDPLLPVANGRRLGELVPGARYVELPGVGHLIPWEEPARAAALIREFLAVPSQQVGR